MAACRSLKHIFQKPLKECSFETFSSWSPIKSMKPVDNASLTELFGQLHFQDNDDGEPATPPSASSLDSNKPTEKKQYRHENSFSSRSSEPLSFCSEGLLFESSDEGDDNISLDWRHRREEKQGANVIQYRAEYIYCDQIRTRVNRESFPPPISCIGSNGRPFVSFSTYRENGRFILKEERIPQYDFLRARRENGRLTMQLVHSDDDFEDEDFDDEDFDQGENEECHEPNFDDEEQEPINNNNVGT